MTLRVLDLFSGIGGFSLGLERAGMRTVAFCEIDPYCRAVLRKHWPRVPIWRDVRHLRGFDGVDLIVGGPPCQRTSVAAAIHGKRTGETLWPEMRRLLPNVERTLIEQPPGNAAWEAKVQTDLEADGFAMSRHVIAACEVGGVNPRRRVFMVADRDRERLARTRKSIASALESIQRGAADGNHWSQDNARAVRVVDGIPCRLDRIARIRSLGNSVIPQIPEIIGRSILEAEGLR